VFAALLAAGCTGRGATPLSAGGLTCPGPSHRDCNAPGTVRWSLALDGQYLVDTFAGQVRVRPVRTSPDGTPPAAAATADLVVYVEDDLVRAIDRSTGRPRWRTQVGAGVAGPRRGAPESVPIVAGGLVAVFVDVGLEYEAEHRLFVLDAATGRQVGGFVPPKTLGDLQTVSAGRLIWIGSGQVTATDPRTGKIVWRQPVRPHFHAALVGDVLYLDHRNEPWKTAQRVDLRNGRRLPDLPVGRDGRVLAESLSGVLFVTTDLPLGVAAVDARTGRRLWWQAGYHDANIPPIVALDTLARPPVAYLSGPDPDTVQAVDARTGAVRRAGIPKTRFGGWGGVVRGVTLGDAGEPVPQGTDLLSGALRWRLPGAVGFQMLAFWSGSDPAIAVGMACAADGVRWSRADEATARTHCAKPRLVAVNW
jgi:outer membrane protein assembly factor BamB